MSTPSGLTDKEREAIAREYELQMNREPRLVDRVLDGLERNSKRALAAGWDRLTRGNGKLPVDGTQVETVEELSTEALRRLFENEVCALVVRGFVERQTCDAVADWLLENSDYKKFIDDPAGDIFTDMFYGGGIPENMKNSSRDMCIAYFEQVLPTIRGTRKAAGGKLAPMDKFRLELDELWPPGANIRVDPGYRRKLCVGTSRMMSPEGMVGESTKKSGIIHTDSWPGINPDRGLFAANLYMRTPESGGELDVWGLSLGTLDAITLSEYLSHAFDPDHRERTQLVMRARFPPPHTVAVRPGDLVMINSGRPHAVRGFSEGIRVTIQSFVMYERDQPLALFS